MKGVSRVADSKDEAEVILIKHQTMKMYGEVEVQFHCSLALDGGELSVLRPGETAPGTHWIGGWAGLEAALNVTKKRKIICCSCRDSNADTMAVQPISWSLHRVKQYITLTVPLLCCETVCHVSCVKVKINLIIIINFSEGLCVLSVHVFNQ
jgi:hypothetical protein